MSQQSTLEATVEHETGCPKCLLEEWMVDFEKLPTVAQKMDALARAVCGDYAVEMWSAYNLIGLVVDVAHQYLAEVGEPVEEGEPAQLNGHGTANGAA